MNLGSRPSRRPSRKWPNCATGTERAANCRMFSAPAPTVGSGQAVLASWKQMIDAGALQSGELHLARTARKPVAVMSAATAERAGITTRVTIPPGPGGSLALDVVVVDMPDAVV